MVVAEGLVISMGGIINTADVVQGIVVIGKMGKTRLARCLGILQAVVAIYEAGGRIGSGRFVVEVEGVISASLYRIGRERAWCRMGTDKSKADSEGKSIGKKPDHCAGHGKVRKPPTLWRDQRLTSHHAPC